MAAMSLQEVLFATAILTAGGFGAFVARAVGVWRRGARHRAVIQEGRRAETYLAPGASSQPGTSLDDRVLAYASSLAVRRHGLRFRSAVPSWLRNRPWRTGDIAKAGLQGKVDAVALREAQVRLAALGCFLGGMVGFVFSWEMAVAAASIGAMVGWRIIPWAVAQRSRCRADQMERHLSEMLDVVALGMHSGLSFDRSLQLYSDHFHTLLAESFASAYRQWSCGLTSRPEALRAVAASYDSALLNRVVENVVRSLRFGATLAGELEDAAREARSSYRARRQEQVAKAPVKMMVPTGVLILPAMLILVLGPVLLELAGGFS